MNEQEWLECADPEAMVEYLRKRITDRKLRLFGIAGIRSVWRMLTDRRCRTAVELAEKFADGQASRLDLGAAGAAIQSIIDTEPDGPLRCMAGATVELLKDPENLQPDVLAWVPIGVCTKHIEPSATEEHWEAWEIIRDETLKEGAKYLRHLIGNPFKPYPAPAAWPSTIVQLAAAQYNGQDCLFALHDALLEAGHGELAEHFKDEALHPKGCWAVDMLLGRE
jgi:hypothetical protein